MKRINALRCALALAALVVDVVALDALGEGVVPGERRGVDDPGVVLKGLGEAPALAERGGDTLGLGAREQAGAGGDAHCGHDAPPSRSS